MSAGAAPSLSPRKGRRIVAAALLAELERLRARLSAIESMARRQRESYEKGYTNFDFHCAHLSALHALILDHKEPT